MIVARLLLALFLSAAMPPEAMVMHAIRSDLAYNAPHLEIDLDAAKPSAAIDNLLRAKIVRVTGKTDGYGLRPRGRLVLVLTARGEQTALSRGWAFGGGMLQIPTGRLSYVAGSYAIQREKRFAQVTYSWRFQGNDNLAFLLRLGKLSTWPRSMFTTCVGGGPKHAPAQKRTISIVPDNQGNWRLFETALISGCVTGT